MKHHRYAVIVLLALAGGACSDLPSHDDPRDYDEGGGGGGPPPGGGGGQAKGTCDTVFFTTCDDRTQAQCNGGCVIAPVCHSEFSEVCPAIQSPDACDSNKSCYWSSGRCWILAGAGCSTYESQTACDATSSACAWGSACSGKAAYCFDATTQAECTANYNCKWTPG